MVLVIDSDPAVRGYVKSSLETVTGTVMEAPSLAEAVDKLSHFAFDMIIVDLDTVGGLDFLREYREQIVPAKVVIHAPGNDPQVIIESLEGGVGSLATNYLIKPASPHQLRETIMAVDRYGDFTVDNYVGDIYYKGKRLQLTGKTILYTIMVTLLKAGRPVNYQDLAWAVYQKRMDRREATNQLKTHIMLLRGILADFGLGLKTRHRQGFEIVVANDNGE